MKFVSIISIALFALFALSSSAPVANENTELQVRFDVYNDLLANLFSGLVQTTMGTVSNFVNQLINENPLGIGKRDASDDSKARLDVYSDLLANLFSGLVQTTMGTVSGFLNQLITENPLGIGKREISDDLKARVDALSFLYDNILANLFSGLVTNTFSTLSNTLTNLIQTNPLGVGKRDASDDLKARFDVYNDLLANLFSGLVQTTMGTVSSFLNQLITENPLGVGKREISDDLKARVDALSFLYDNILANFFSGLVTNTFSTLSNTLTNLIETNPLGVGKRDVSGDLAARVDALSFLYDNILANFFSGLVTNTFSTLGNTLTNLIQTNPLGVGKRALDLNISSILELFNNIVANVAHFLQNSLNGIFAKPNANLRIELVNLEQAKAIIAETISTLITKFKTFTQAVIAVWNDRPQLMELINDNIAHIKTIVTQLAQQLSHLIPSTIIDEVSQVLAALKSVLVFWTSGLGGSLGPVLGPFLQ